VSDCPAASVAAESATSVPQKVLPLKNAVRQVRLPVLLG
jgi:hypothetical protein